MRTLAILIAIALAAGCGGGSTAPLAVPTPSAAPTSSAPSDAATPSLAPLTCEDAADPRFPLANGFALLFLRDYRPPTDSQLHLFILSVIAFCSKKGMLSLDEARRQAYELSPSLAE